MNNMDENAIAIVGMAGRFPGATNLDAFWQNLKAGVESISFFSDAELRQAGVPPERLQDANYIKAAPLLADSEFFDAAFFGYAPAEAIALDPQQRLFLECAWESLEHAGYNPDTYPGAIGVYGGIGINTYMLYSRTYPDLSGDFLTSLAGSSPDFLATRTAYKLNLRGPSVTVQTACSTALVAVHMACQSLLNGEMDMALAGAVSLWILPKSGYQYLEGGIVSPDGHCRAFDKEASGTLFGNGVGLVVLKRLTDALADGDHIHAVIRGSAVNNDGSGKIGYTATSVDGQAQVIAEALALAGVDPDSVTYVEAHGTGTALGDPIEIAGLTKAFRAGTDRTGYCAVGSVKSNIGHMGVASGIAGLLKTVLALDHKLVPPSLHFETPNPQIDFANSPFYVVTQPQPWSDADGPRRAGVSSLGIGGTNAHAILEEAPSLVSEASLRPEYLLVCSAKTPKALAQAQQNLAAHLERHPDLDLADVAFTLQVGRKPFYHRSCLVVRDRAEAIAALTSGEGLQIADREPRPRPVAFMFSGQGAQYGGMAQGLYQREPVFADLIDRQAQLLKPLLGMDLRQILYPQAHATHAAQTRLEQTRLAQPALFVVEYALARLWQSWGVAPQAMIGHSIGEYVAACLAGVFTLEEALTLVAARGRLMQQVAGGQMLSIRLPLEEVNALLDADLALAASNGPLRQVVAGPTERIERLQAQLVGQGVDCRLLRTSHAFHSPMLDPIRESLRQHVGKISLQPPQIPYLSNVTGTWITAEEATDPDYWVRHLREPVQFDAGLHELLTDPERILLEVGPGVTLSTLAQEKAAGHLVLCSLPHPRAEEKDSATLLKSLGQLWLAGTDIDWSGFYAHERRLRLVLPTYPFERERYWLDPQPAAARSGGHPLLGERLRSPLNRAVQFASVLSVARLPYLHDHRVHGLIVLPAAAYLEAVLAAAGEVFGTQGLVLEEVVIQEPLILSEAEQRHFQVILERKGDRSAGFEVFSLVDAAADAWTRHVTGLVRVEPTATPPTAPDRAAIAELQARCPMLAEYYRPLAQQGLEYGPTFQGIAQLWRRDGEAFAQLKVPQALMATLGAYQIHPALFDSFLQVSVAALPRSQEDIYLPLSLEQVRVLGPVSTTLWASAQVQPGTQSQGETFTVDLLLWDETGRVVAQIRGLLAKRASRGALLRREPWEDGLYTIQWQARKRAATRSMAPGSWLILADRGGWGMQVARLLEERGESCTLVYAGTGAEELDPSQPEGFHQQVQEWFKHAQRPPKGVLHLWGLQTTDLETAQLLGCGSALSLVQGLVQQASLAAGPPPRLWLVTQGVQAITKTDRVDVAQATLWGLGRVVAQEHPELWGGLVDLDLTTPAQAKNLVEELLGSDGEDQLAFRAGERLTARLVQERISKTTPLALSIEGSYLVTGGLGALGLQVARWLVDRGARSLVLVGRKGPSASAIEVLAALEQAGAQILVLQADIAQFAEVERVLGHVLLPLKGIIHAAGALDDGVLLRQDWERFARVLAPKVQGAWHLHRLTRDLPLDFFVLFSSIAALLGSPGQGNYTAANAFLDALAHRRRAEGLPALSVNWGPWAEGGMATARGDRQVHPWLNQGLELIPPEQAFAALEQLLAQNLTQRGVMPVRWAQFLQQYPAGGAPALLRDMLPAAVTAPALDLNQRLAQALPGERLELLVNHVREQAAKVLGFTQTLDPRQPLRDLGLDSLLALNLTRNLGATLGRTLPATLLFNHPTVEALAGHLARGVLALDLTEPEAPPMAPDSLDHLATQLQALSEDELEALLLQKLDLL
ncbi:type I polyketide synthase [Anthocerotibacter panamensis]|uniref:type I polyketide synthase n=1 Tax=Anthocerotibacter panamensis TaxID=2857077 RepID=UPI001C403FCB|nr:type I polyketide synthase [Anthocerotibacter panamensis]